MDSLSAPGASVIEKWSKRSSGSHGKRGVTTIACCCGSKAVGAVDSSATINAENGTFRPVAIFHKVATVGLDSFRSTCPSIAFDTPVSSASRDRLQPRC